MSYERSIDWIGDRPGRSFQQWLARRLVERFLGDSKPGLVLEIGTGVGRCAVEISRLGHRYFGVEPTTSLRNATLTRLRASSQSAKVVNSTLPDLAEVAEQEFSHALAINVLEHASSSETALQWINGIARKVKPGGRILIVCPNFLDFEGYFYDVDWTHSWVSTTSRISMIGAEAGLRVVEERDLRGSFSNPIMKTALCVLSWLIPTQLINWVMLQFFNIRNFGTGIQSGLLWRMSWVIFQRDLDDASHHRG